jgi:ABC-2 type transport system ATP-binding protein
MAPPIISFRGVSKAFGTARVLSAVDFDVPAGSSFALAGENGAGKTTLMKCMLDFCAFEGEIRLRGLPSGVPGSRSCLAFLPERFNPPWFLTGREFVRAMLELGRSPWSEERTRAVFADLGLAAESLERPVREFSKGMNQKLGLAACLLSQRELLVLDEPMSGLDPSARFRVKNLLLRLKAEGRTVFFTSHSLADLEEICDHMAVLHAGAVAFTGPPPALRERTGERTLERAFLRCIEEGGHV